MRFFKIVLIVALSLVALFAMTGLIAGASEGKPDASCYVFVAAIGAISILCVYFLVKNLRKNKRDVIQKTISAQQPIGQTPGATYSSSNNSAAPPAEPTDKDTQSAIERIAEVISSENGEPMSLELVAQRINVPPAEIGVYISDILFDVLTEVTAIHPILSEKQEKTVRELAAVCGAALSKDVENQLGKLATIRDIVSFKADPREFVRKSLLVE
jgi:hypothetical protein